MFIRRTKTRQTANGECYYSHRLVRSERVGSQVQQRTLLNLGRHFEVAQDDWPLLCQRLDQLLGVQNAPVPLACPEIVEREAQRVLAQLLIRERVVRAETPDTTLETAAIQTVDVDSLELLRPRSVGVEHVGLWAMQQVGLMPLLAQLGLNGPQRAAVVGSIIGRMAAPGSELATHGWLGQRSALGELLDVDFETMSLMQLYRASDVLMKHRAKIEQQVFDQAMDLFDLGTTVTLYDLTNTYFEGAAAGQPKARRGCSKEKRSDCPLLTLGLVLDGSGFVRRSEVFAGNVGESTTLMTMLEGLGAPAGALVVMDRGVATATNLSWLRQQGYRYLVVSRERTRQFDAAQAMTIETASKQQVHLHKVVAEDGGEVRLYCYSEARAKKEQGITQRFSERFERALQKLADGLMRPRTRKGLDQLWQRIGRLKEASHGVAQHYKIDLIADDSGKKAVALKWEKQPLDGTMQTHPGVYCLRTNETAWDEETLWRTYMMLTDLEAVFRSLKSELGLRPIFHHKQIRADGHLFITVLAYQLVQLIRHRLNKGEKLASWHTLRQTLAGQQRATASFRRPDGRALHVRKATQAEPDQRAIYDALGIDPAPGGIKKIIV